MAKTTENGAVHYTVEISHFHIGTDVGDLPVKVVDPVVGLISPGMLFPATTKGTVAFDVTGRLRIAIPLPFTLSNDAPNGGYTPVPLRTAQPAHPRKAGRPAPTPTAAPSPAASASPAALSSPA